jgi:RHS repeat-associated protein
MRDVTNWQVYPQGSQPAMNYGGRGYTGHEHLNQFGLINMNARLYDPLLGRFLAPDPQVANPDETNGFNRYAYASNNPLMFTDPSSA